MLEGVLERVLLNVFGDYVEDFNREQLRVSVWAGDITLSNLKFRSSALDDLDLPIRVLSGSIRSLKASVPWTRLNSASVHIALEGVYVLAGPVADRVKRSQDGGSHSTGGGNPDRDDMLTYSEKVSQALKKRILAQHEKLKQRAAQQQDATYSERMIARIVRNLHITVSSIHVRYEDNVLIPHSPFSCGLTIDSLSVQTIDAAGNVTFLVEKDENAVTTTNKLVKLSRGALYWHCNSKMVHALGPAAVDAFFQKTAGEFESKLEDYTSAYVLHPLDITMKAILNNELDVLVQKQLRVVHELETSILDKEYSKASDDGTPNSTSPATTDVQPHPNNHKELISLQYLDRAKHKLNELLNQSAYSLSFNVSSLYLSLSHNQYFDCIRILDFFSRMSIQQGLDVLRARLPSFPKRHPSNREWMRKYWKQAMQNTLMLARSRSMNFKWEEIHKYSVNRQRYCALYMKSLQSHAGLYNVTPLSASELAEKTKLEMKLSLDSVLIFRSLVEKQLDAHQGYLEVMEKRRNDDQAGKKSGKGSFWSRVTKKRSETKGSKNDESVEEETQIMMQAITLTAEQKREVWEREQQMPPHFRKLHLNVELSDARICLTHTVHLDSPEQQTLPIAQIILAGNLSLNKYLKSWAADMKIHELSLTDQITPNTKFPSVIAASNERTFDTAVSPHLSASSPPNSNNRRVILSISYHHSLKEFSLSPYDASFHINLIPIVITFSPLFLHTVIHFFRAPASYLNLLASKSYAKTTRSLMTALSNHRSWDIQIRVERPRLVLPEDSQREDSRIMIIQFESFEMRSRKHLEKGIRLTEELMVSCLNQQNEHVVGVPCNPAFYDSYQMSIRNMSLYICPSITEWQTILSCQYDNQNAAASPLLSIIGGLESNSEKCGDSISSYHSTKGLSVDLAFHVCVPVPLELVQTSSNTPLPARVVLDCNISPVHVSLCSNTYEVFSSIQYSLTEVILPLTIEEDQTDAVKRVRRVELTETESTMFLMASAENDAISSLIREHSNGNEGNSKAIRPKSPRSPRRPRVDSQSLPRSLIECSFVLSEAVINITTPRKMTNNNNMGDESQSCAEEILFSTHISHGKCALLRNPRELLVTFDLRSFALQDFFQLHKHNSPFTYFASSIDIPIYEFDRDRWKLVSKDLDKPLLKDESDLDDLIKVSYRAILKPFLFSKNELEYSTFPDASTPILQFLDCTFNTLHLSYNPNSVAEILAYFRSKPFESAAHASTSVPKHNSKDDTLLHVPLKDNTRESRIDQIKNLFTPPTKQRSSSASSFSVTQVMKIRARLKKLTLTLNKENEGRQLFRLEMQESSLQHLLLISPSEASHVTETEIKRGDEFYTVSQVEGVLGNVLLIDLSSPSTMYRELFGLAPTSDPRTFENKASGSSDSTSLVSLLKFSYTSFHPSRPIDTFNGEGSHADELIRKSGALSLHANSIKIVYVHQIINEFFDYIKDYVFDLFDTPAEPNNSPQVKPKDDVFSQIDIVLDNPVVIFPRHENSAQFVRVDLGRVFISNSMSGQRMLLDLNFESMNWSTSASATEHDKTIVTPLFFDVALKCTVLLPLPDEKISSDMKDYLEVFVNLSSTAIKGTLTTDQLQTFLHVWFENIKAPPLLRPLYLPSIVHLSELMSTTPRMIQHKEENSPITFDINLKISAIQLDLQYQSHSFGIPSKFVDNTLGRVNIGFLSLQCTRFQSLHFQGALLMSGILLTDLRSKTSDSPFKTMLSSAGQLRQNFNNLSSSPYTSSSTRTSDIQENQHALMDTVDIRSVLPSIQPPASALTDIPTETALNDLEFHWQDYIDDRRESQLFVNEPCGFLLPDFWVSLGEFFSTPVDQAMEDHEHRFQEWHVAACEMPAAYHIVQRQFQLEESKRQHKQRRAQLPDEDKLAVPFRSFCIQLKSFRLFLMEDPASSDSRAIGISGNLLTLLKSSEEMYVEWEGKETEWWPFKSATSTFDLNNLRVYVCRADTPIDTSSASILTSCNIQWNVQSNLEKRYASYSPETSEGKLGKRSYAIETTENSETSVLLSTANSKAGSNGIEVFVSYEDMRLLYFIFSNNINNEHHQDLKRQQKIINENLVRLRNRPKRSQNSMKLTASTANLEDLSILHLKTSMWNLNWKMLQLVLINDCGSRYVPVLKLQMHPSSVVAILKDRNLTNSLGLSFDAPQPDRWCQRVSKWKTITSKLRFEAHMFNDRVINYEPFIEPIQLDMQLIQEPVETEENVESESGLIEYNSVDKFPPAPSWSIRLAVQEKLNLNLSYVFLRHLYSTIQSWQIDFKSPKKNNNFSPYILKNSTGGVLKFKVRSLGQHFLERQSPKASVLEEKSKSHKSAGKTNNDSLPASQTISTDGEVHLDFRRLHLSAPASDSSTVNGMSGMDTQQPFKLDIVIDDFWVLEDIIVVNKNASSSFKLQSLRERESENTLKNVHQPSPTFQPRLFVDITLRVFIHIKHYIA